MLGLVCLIPSLLTAETALTVDQIVDRHIEARGGAAALRALRNIVYSQGLYQEAAFTGAGDAYMALGRPHVKVVGNPESPSWGFMEGWDGSAWEWFADPGIVIRTVGAASAASRHGADLEGHFLDYREKGTAIRLGEPEEIGDRPAHRLHVTLRDGFEQEYFFDRESYLVIAQRKTAPFHAFGDPITTETRVGDYREIAGVLIAHRYEETVIATGEPQSSIQWGSVEANVDLPDSWFAPPEFERSPLQSHLEALYQQRTDPSAVMWSYEAFRRAQPDVETRDGIEMIGFQMQKMGAHDSAVALLKRNATNHPDSSTSALSLGRAYEGAGRPASAQREYDRALALDPENQRATRALEELELELDNPLGFFEPFIGSWGMAPESEAVRANPWLASSATFRFDWADPQRKLLRFYEGVPDDDFGARILDNLVTYNPRTGEVVALGYQLRNDFLYESTFRPQEDGFVREYVVTYPEGYELHDEEDRERGWIRYRDRCRLDGSDRLHCVTEQKRGDMWQAWRGSAGYTLVRR